MYFDKLLKDKKDLSLSLSSKNYLFNVQFINCLLEIKTNSAKIANSINYLYKAMIVNKDKEACLVPVKYCYFKDNGHYILTRNQKLAYSLKNFPEAVSRFDWMLMSDIVDHNRHLPIIHASSVVKDGGAVIFVGISGSGKSSLSLLLGLDGWGFIGDDVILLDKGIRGVPRAFCLDERVVQTRIERKVPHIKGLKRGRNYLYIDPYQLDIEINYSISPIKHVIFLEKGLKKNILQRLSSSMTLHLLVENLFDTKNSFKEKIDILIDLTSGAKGAKLIWSDFSRAIREVRKFISSG